MWVIPTDWTRENISHAKLLKGVVINSKNEDRITNLSENGWQTCYPTIFQGAFILQALAVVCQQTDSVAALVLRIPIPPSLSYSFFFLLLLLLFLFLLFLLFLFLLRILLPSAAVPGALHFTSTTVWQMWLWTSFNQSFSFTQPIS